MSKDLPRPQALLSNLRIPTNSVADKSFFLAVLATLGVGVLVGLGRLFPLTEREANLVALEGDTAVDE